MGGNNSKLNLALINMVQNSNQLRGLSTKEPLAHLKKFLHFANTIITTDIIRLRLFPFLLANKALKWLTTLPDEAITMWDECTHKFLLKYFPPSKSNILKEDIKCPQHDFSRGQLIQIF
ncbi:hypothetical protein CR513_32081, partial [Mucuna pruriens]